MGLSTHGSRVAESTEPIDNLTQVEEFLWAVLQQNLPRTSLGPNW